MNLIDLMEIWALRNNQTTPSDMLKLGEFDSRIDKDLLVGAIIQKCGAMKPIYDTTESYTFFHKIFFQKWSTQISELIDTTQYEYEPLENFRRKEDLQHDAIENTKGTSNDKGHSVSSENSTSNTNDENKTSAYNESVYQPETNETINTKEDTGSTTDDTNDNIYAKDRTFGTKEDNTIRGLNGLFTTQQLVEQQRKVVQFNVYEWITTKYMEELFVCVF